MQCDYITFVILVILKSAKTCIDAHIDGLKINIRLNLQTKCALALAMRECKSKMAGYVDKYMPVNKYVYNAYIIIKQNHIHHNYYLHWLEIINLWQIKT